MGNGTQAEPLDGPARTTPFYIPIDLAMSPEGELWILDVDNYVVRAIACGGSST
jgi:hypothetical protein